MGKPKGQKVGFAQLSQRVLGLPFSSPQRLQFVALRKQRCSSCVSLAKSPTVRCRTAAARSAPGRRRHMATARAGEGLGSGAVGCVTGGWLEESAVVS